MVTTLITYTFRFETAEGGLSDGSHRSALLLSGQYDTIPKASTCFGGHVGMWVWLHVLGGHVGMWVWLCVLGGHVGCGCGHAYLEGT